MKCNIVVLSTENRSLLRIVNTTRKNELTPKAVKFYYEALKLKRKSDKLTKSVTRYKTRIKLAEKYIKEDNSFHSVSSKVNKITYNFILSQLKTQNKKPNGRRYTQEDKILALSIFKQSPKAYNYLSTIFSLPSPKTLNLLLQNIPFYPGLNKHIIENLKNQSQKLSENDRNCILLFDEMALNVGLKYDLKKDYIFGFQDFGPDNRSSEFADHVLVFMIRGLRKKWKQPVSYYFCKGSTSTLTLSNLITDVITAINEAGFKVRATVSDQGKTNVAAINNLLKITNQKIVSAGEVNTYVGYVVNNVEVLHIYDPPHLLKCVRNNLLTKDVTFLKDGKKYRASWSYIVNLYELDKKNELLELRALPKLTDMHIYADKMKKMKVSSAAQIFSQRVASTMKLMCNHGKFTNPYTCDI